MIILKIQAIWLYIIGIVAAIAYAAVAATLVYDGIASTRWWVALLGAALMAIPIALYISDTMNRKE